MNTELLKEAQSFNEDLITWRRSLHAIPELDLALPMTSAYVQSELKKMGIPFKTMVGGSCVVAMLGRGEKCFLLRSDMDGLPFAEESGESFASENGCMHACGHDMHAAILLGAAKLLKAHEAELDGTVKLLFQPGEETFRGAKAAIDEGLLEEPKVDAAFAMHVASVVPFGCIAYGPDPMAAVYSFRITLNGKGGHGSTPEACIDPITAGVHVHLALQELISRECSPSAEVALTIGKFQAGSASNVIPESAVLEGTIRVFRPDVKAFIVKRLHEIVPAVAAAYRTTADIEVLGDLPSVACDDGLNDELVGYISEIAPEMTVVKRYHVMGSEDFAFISDKIPSSYMCLGAAVDDTETHYGQHNPKVRFNEKCLAVGAAAYAGVAMKWLAEH